MCVQALALMGNFSHPCICWKGNSRTNILESSDENFLTQVTVKPTRRGMLLDLTLTNNG